MEKEFVKYEQALTLKELGFDEDCFGFYNLTITKTVIMNNNSYGGFGLTQDHIIAAPLYQQVFRWFREKHQIEAIVSCIYSKTLDISYEERRYHCYIVRDGITTKGANFKTYEEAESVCLDKLLEICKNK